MTAAAPPPRPAEVAVDPRMALRDAARLLVAGAPPQLLLEALDDRTRTALARAAGPDPLLQRSVPNNVEAERNVLSAALGWPEAFEEALARLPEDAWYGTTHAALWGVMRRLRARNAPVDVTTVAAELVETGDELLDRLGGHAGLADLCDSMGSGANVGYWCAKLEDAATKRRMLRAAVEVVNAAHEPTLTARDLQTEAESKLATAVGRPLFRRADGTEAARDLDRLIDRARSGGGFAGYSTGYAALEELPVRLKPGEFSAIGARTSMGKTTFALNLVLQLLADGHKVGIVSLEMERPELIANLAAARVGVDGQRLRDGVLTEDELGRVERARDWLRDEVGPRLQIDDAEPGAFAETLSRVRSLATRDGCQVVFLDYLQLVQVEDPRHEHAELAQLSRGLKKITRAVPTTHVCAIAQLNRDTEKRRSPRPALSDLGGSSKIEADLDVAFLLFRPSYYDPEKGHPKLLEVRVAKNRNGPTGVVKLSFDRACLRIEDAPPEGFPEPEKAKKRFGKGKAKADPGESQD